ncbi:MAG TPA: ATPase domain-containing protein [Thermoplasmata archaeon]|nr:ATPase domain-containing protein [Thermoplasmata archaeon]
MEELIPTRLDGLDQVLGGGIPRGHLILVAGTPGTMKSTLCYTTMYNNAVHGQKGLYISLEQDGEHLRASMAKLGMDDTGDGRVYILDLGTIRRELAEREQKKDWTRMLLDVTRQAVQEDRYTMVTIDSLEAFYALANLENPRRELFHFFTEMKELGVTTFFITEVPIGSKILTRYGEDFLADGMFLLQHVDVGETDVQLRMRIVKMRNMPHSQGWFAVHHDGQRFLISHVLSRRRREGLVEQE